MVPPSLQNLAHPARVTLQHRPFLCVRKSPDNISYRVCVGHCPTSPSPLSNITATTVQLVRLGCKTLPTYSISGCTINEDSAIIPAGTNVNGKIAPVNIIISEYIYSKDFIIPKSIDAPLKGGTSDIINDKGLRGYKWNLIEPEIKLGVHDENLTIPDSDNNKIRSEISLLLHDIGIQLSSDYSPSWTGALLRDVPGVLKDSYQYKSVGAHDNWPKVAL